MKIGKGSGEVTTISAHSKGTRNEEDEVSWTRRRRDAVPRRHPSLSALDPEAVCLRHQRGKGGRDDRGELLVMW